MQTRVLRATTSAAIALLLGSACDTPVETAEQTPAAAPVQASAGLHSKLDLQAVVDVVASGEVDSAAALETRLAADAIAHVDLDDDGKRDELRIVEKRLDKRTVFEIRAVPSSQVEFDLALAPPVATLTLEAKADAGVAVARASYATTFAAASGLDASATVEHTFSGVRVEASGRMGVDASVNAFVGWTFRVGRPIYVAEVFIVEHDEPRTDPCWPPGHCKHGFWKATGEGKPGHAKHGDTTLVRVEIDHRSDRGHGGKAHHGGSKGPSKSSGKGKGGKGKGKGGKGK